MRSSGATKTSIASRGSRVVTIAIRPSYRRGTREVLEVICPTAKAENFRKQEWTLRLGNRPGTDLPVGQACGAPDSDHPIAYFWKRCFSIISISKRRIAPQIFTGPPLKAETFK